ncbi:Hypothetical predicted protein [Podarcis lilfordi]|uniref:Uncharacterized protein n=1 Tax=Podarcis lilfordi TaxID=74358 RepID=A0AA35K1N1_9SAUR|nr:Hypothetical predicted protein [Podarcis lilfordi]
MKIWVIGHSIVHWAAEAEAEGRRLKNFRERCLDQDRMETKKKGRKIGGLKSRQVPLPPASLLQDTHSLLQNNTGVFRKACKCAIHAASKTTWL